jgi:hypothetical protein
MDIPPDRQGQHVALPYGDTLHYQGCGCPRQWRAGTRPADFVDLLVYHSYAGYRKRWAPVRPLNIAYMLPHHNVTGTGPPNLVRGRVCFHPDGTDVLNTNNTRASYDDQVA